MTAALAAPLWITTRPEDTNGNPHRRRTSRPARPAAVTVTVHIALDADPLPPAAAQLIESLQALAEPPARPALAPVPSPAEPGLRVHLASRTVSRDGTPARLTRREYDLLAFLCVNPRRVFSRTQLLQQVWGYELVSGERTVDVHVRRLRVKLGPVVCTVRGVGYRLDESVPVDLISDLA